jgi:hypothetical protein
MRVFLPRLSASLCVTVGLFCSSGAARAQNPTLEVTYAVNGKQYIAAAAGLSLFVFALP